VSKLAPAREAPGGKAQGRRGPLHRDRDLKGARFEYQAKAPKKARGGAQAEPAAIAEAYVVLADGTRTLSSEIKLMAPKGSGPSPRGRPTAASSPALTTVGDAKDGTCDGYGATWGPSVELVAEKSLGQGNVSRVESELWKKGVNVARTARRSRPGTRAWSTPARASRKQAKKVAAMVPGGATVAPHLEEHV